MSWMEQAAKVLPVEKAYDDLVSPAFKEIGEAARNTVKASRFILAPIDYLSAQHDRWLHYLKRVSEKVPEEQLIAAHPHLAGKVIESLRYLEEENLLTELFLNLLARAIDRERVSEAHPAFASVIAQLSPDEAIVLFYLNEKNRLLKQHSAFNAHKNTFGAPTTLDNQFPLEKLAFPQNYFMYCDHLHSLNLAGIWQSGNQHSITANGIQTGVEITSYAQLTEFGRLFAKACLPKELPKSEKTTSGT